MKIATEEWQAALDDLVGPSEPEITGLTVSEVASRNGIGTTTARSRLTKSLAKGLVCRGWAWRPDSTGRRQRVTVYAPVQAKTGKK